MEDEEKTSRHADHEEEDRKKKHYVGSRGARLGFCVFLFLGFVLSLFAKGGFFSFLKDIPGIHTCDDDECVGIVVVYRISFSLFVFYFTHIVLLTVCCHVGFKEVVQQRFWFFKFLYWIVLLVITLFIPNKFFIAFAFVCLIIAGIFILLQLIIVLEFSYAWNESWVDKEWFGKLLGVSVTLFVGALVLLGFSFHWFTTASSCELNKFFLTMTLVLGILYTLASMKAEHGALLPSSIVFAFCMYWTWSALFSEPSSESCNSLSDNSSGELWQLITAAAFAIMSLIYTTMRTSESTEAFSTENPDAVDDDEDAGPKEKFVLFHFIMIAASCYMTAIVTNWSLKESDGVMEVDSGWTSTWVKIVSTWVMALMYTWTIIAPLICPDRDFGFD